MTLIKNLEELATVDQDVLALHEFFLNEGRSGFKSQASAMSAAVGRLHRAHLKEPLVIGFNRKSKKFSAMLNTTWNNMKDASKANWHKVFTVNTDNLDKLHGYFDDVVNSGEKRGRGRPKRFDVDFRKAVGEESEWNDLNEGELLEFNSMAGNGAAVSDPEVTGDAHANRRADNKVNGDPMPKLDTKNDPLSKVEVIRYVLNQIQSSSDEDAMKLYNKIAGEFENRKESGNEVNIKSIATKEDVDNIFVGAELTEEAKTSAHVLFEAAVAAKVIEKEDALKEEYENKLIAIEEEYATKLNEALNYFAESYIEENKLAIASGIRVEIAESFLNGMKDLFTEHYVTVPEEKADLVDDLSTYCEELEEKVNHVMKENAELYSTVEEFECARAFDELTEGMTVTAKEKLASLAENIEFSSVDEFVKKLTIIKENNLNSTTKKTIVEDSVMNDVVLPEENPVNIDVAMAPYVAAISKTIRK